MNDDGAGVPLPDVVAEPVAVGVAGVVAVAPAGEELRAEALVVRAAVEELEVPDALGVGVPPHAASVSARPTAIARFLRNGFPICRCEIAVSHDHWSHILAWCHIFAPTGAGSAGAEGPLRQLRGLFRGDDAS